MHYPSASNSNQRQLHTFHGGLHIADNKAQSTSLPVVRSAIPRRLILPLQQHIGASAQPLVEVGQRVLKGEMIARSQGRVSAHVHAPTSGTVVEIAPQSVPHPSGLKALCIVIESDGEERWAELPPPLTDFEQCDPDQLRERVREAGIVGLGGAAFPTSVKLSPSGDAFIHTLVINGAECEPYITCDDMLMRDRAERIITGVHILTRLLDARECLIGIEDNKPQAIEAMTRALQQSGLQQTEVVPIPTLYPSGGEKQLIRVLTGKEVPSGGIPAHIGIVCQNVATAAAVADAVLDGKPLIERYVTLTGEGVGQPRNLQALIGTPLRELIEQAGDYTDKASRLILGGPMMGFTLGDDQVPLTKAANCLLVPSAEEAPDPGAPAPCIRCGQCAAVCPVNLLPQQMYWFARAKDLERVQEYSLFDCIECGCCSHVCPSHIPLVQYYRFAKNECWDQEREKRKAEEAKTRHEARLARLAKLEAAKKARMQKKKAALKNQPAAKKKASAEAPKKQAIEDAVKRAAEKKAKLAAEGVKPANTENLTPAQQKQVDRANARRVETNTPAKEREQPATAEQQQDT